MSSVRSDLRQRRAALESEWSRWVPELRAARRAPAGKAPLRPEVTDSWVRSLHTVDPGVGSAPVTDGGEVRPRWADSPLRRPVSDLADELNSIADDAGFVAGVTDESGTLLWTCGGRVMRRRAEQVNFAPGGRWDESAMGTNALSLALRTGRPSAVFSAEHLVAALHGWACYCAPIHAPDGRILGVLDLSTTWDRSHPLAMSTVRSLVSTIETRLRADLGTGLGARQRNGTTAGRGTGATGAAGVRLTCLGAGQAVRAGARLRLRPRQLEILTLLALEPAGYPPERLRDALYGERPVTASTFKAEVSHLRRALGDGVATRTYALTTPVDCDAVEVLRALAAGDTEGALNRYSGPLLPQSEAPGIRAWREHLEVAVREAVLTSPVPEHALTYGARAPHDAEIHQHALRVLPPHDPRRALAAGRLSTALRD
ncbi:helix-turn-helix domain-containing protein [Streptomyces violens]|uniref:helix-turn-helix domain-containing protein n=1 Tax=Streptomyces violens TaxID=66377 RepID=UPI0004C2544E|nr:helix-turn-helix domain-containing protein [Streptomyces violens]